ncbi:hypothetical protein [Kocuria rhizophila]|uniref:hypothetical protein n=1 Tax=Kocuria rhizophila TaxID=72000 RepID=UPI000AE8DDA7|nr:hypothetical protein [Kocuria rhizophila]
MTQQWQSDLEAWAGGWAAIREDEAPQGVRAWNGSLPQDTVSDEELVLVCELSEADAVREAVAAAGREVLSSQVLLSAAVQDLDRGLGFPGDAGLFDAPMGDWSRFEVDEWGCPVAHSTLSVQGDVAFMGPLVAGTAEDRDPAEVVDPLVSAMANEAFLADAQRLYTVVPEEDVPGREPQGWRRAAAVLLLS